MNRLREIARLSTSARLRLPVVSSGSFRRSCRLFSMVASFAIERRCVLPVIVDKFWFDMDYLAGVSALFCPDLCLLVPVIPDLVFLSARKVWMIVIPLVLWFCLLWISFALDQI